MPDLWTIIGCLGHALAAVVFASLAILTSRQAAGRLDRQLFVVALALTALWSLRHALILILIDMPLTDGITETMRNAAWLAVVVVYLGHAPAGRAARWSRPAVIAALALLLVVQLGFDLVVGEGASINAGLLPVFSASWLLRCTFALGALFLLHGLSNKRECPEATDGAVWLGGALAFMWAYDFNHYILFWLTNGAPVATGPMRGFVMALLALPLALGLRADDQRAVALSRPVLLRLVSAAVLAVYLISVLLLVSLTGDFIAPFGRLVQIGLLFAVAVAVLALMPSASLRAWLRVEITKHLFAHRYDYRTVWLGFAATVGKSGDGLVPLGARLARAIAEVVQAPCALLFLRGGDGKLVRAHDWQWPADAPPTDTLPAALIDRIEGSAWMIDIAADWSSFGALLPAWMENDARAWVLAPLVHGSELVGAVLLASPAVKRRLDWEDLDVLRVVCGEAAALISEARSRAALAEAQRFDEFNRRFAFILHDLKNLVSQMSLLAGNAARHADNPDFRADMVLTLKETAARMTDLVQRLGRPDTARAGASATVMLGPFVRALQLRWASGLGPVQVSGDGSRAVRADQDALERVLLHLVKNAIEASPQGIPVQVELAEEQGHALIHVVDQGCGMSDEFIRDELFRPFSSTKANGFGLGVHEARLLVTGMDGVLDVTSAPGAGTRFTIRLPLAETAADDSNEPGGAGPGPDSNEPMRRTG